MDGQNPKQNPPPRSHGLRLIKGSSASAHAADGDANNRYEPSKGKKNKLVTQLSALADAIDNDVKQLLNL
jgi:hypothetical protein